MIEFSQKFIRSDDVLFQELDGEAVLLDLSSEQYFGLDEVGTRIWQLLETQNSLGVIQQTLLDEYEVSEDQLRDDLIGFAQRLNDAGLIKVHAEPETSD